MNRRRFLGATGATAATALAGCLGVLDGGSGNDYDVVTKYMYAQDGAESSRKPYTVTHESPTTLLELDDRASTDLEAQLRQETDFAWGDVDPQNLKHHIQIDAGREHEAPACNVYRGSFDLDDIRDGLAEKSEETSTYEGFDFHTVIWESAEGEATVPVALGEGIVLTSVGSLGRDGSVDQLEQVIDTAYGDAEPITAVDEALGELTTRMRTGIGSTISAVNPDVETDVEDGYFRGLTADGSGYTAEGDGVVAYAVFGFESDERARSAPIEEFAAMMKSRGDLDSVSHSVEGNVVEFRGPTSVEGMLPV